MRVFLDTNVLVSAVTSRGLCRDLLRTALEEHEIVVSQVVIEEFERVLRDKFRASRAVVERALMLLDDVEVAQNPNATFAAGALETSDVLILTAAIDAQADVLVTGDHEMLAQTHGLPIDVISPREFMERTSRPQTYPFPADGDDEPTVSEPSGDTIGARAFEFALSILELSSELEGRVDAVIVRPLLRAGTSIGAKIEGASAAQRWGDSLVRMCVALRHAQETHYWLRLIDRSGAAPEVDVAPHFEGISELIRQLSAIVETPAGWQVPSLLEEADDLESEC